MKHEKFYRALATALVTTIGIMLWIAAIATIMCGCATHKERTEVHKSDSASVIQEQKQANILTEITSNKTFSFDSIIINETVLSSGDSGCSETAHRRITIRGFKATTITNTTNKVDSTSKKIVTKESHNQKEVVAKSEANKDSLASTIKWIIFFIMFFIILGFTIRVKNKFGK